MNTMRFEDFSKNEAWSRVSEKGNFYDTQEVKLMIINNFIDYFTSNEEERIKMKNSAVKYVDEDHVDEILQSFPELKK